MVLIVRATNSICELNTLRDQLFASFSELLILCLHLVADVKEIETLFLPNTSYLSII